jgi:hypothetical protein
MQFLMNFCVRVFNFIRVLGRASFLVGQDGNVYEGRGWDNMGAHAQGEFNPISHGICFIGSFQGEATEIPSARLTLHSTKLCTNFKIFRKKLFFVTKVNSSEAF